MFAYCENNPVNAVDPTGEDAWWLQDTNAVFGCGHTSLLIQESKGKWWYFYWGPNEIRLIYIGTCNLRGNNNRTLNNILHNNRDLFGNQYYKETYNRFIKLNGNFYNSLVFIAKMLNTSFPAIKKMKDGSLAGYTKYSNNMYNLFSLNCVQMSVQALRCGRFSAYPTTYARLLSYMRTLTVPNDVYDTLILGNRCIAMYGNKSYNMMRRFIPGF